MTNEVTYELLKKVYNECSRGDDGPEYLWVGKEAFFKLNWYVFTEKGGDLPFEAFAKVTEYWWPYLQKFFHDPEQPEG